MEHSNTRARMNTRTKIVATALVLGLIGIVGGFSTWSAFSATTANEANSFQSGSVVLSDDDSNTSMFALTGLKPGEPGAAGAKCIKVTYGGSLPASVKLYGSTTAGTLGTYLNVKVTRGTMATSNFPSCTGFTADVTEYIGGQGGGVVYNDTLANFPSTYAAGIAHPSTAWTNGTAAVYRFEVAVQDNNNAQSKSATGVSFTWEAQNN
jgi:hypothetical protein